MSALTLALREFTHFHLAGGSGLGARGFNEASVRVGSIEGRLRCLGSVDVDPAACRDFERMTGVKATCLDLFPLSDFLAYHRLCPGAKRKCHGCNNTGKPLPGWREATAADLWNAAQGEHPDIVFSSFPCKSFSGLLSAKKAELEKYEALSRLTIRGMSLMFDAFGDNPPSLFIFENVPLIATRGRALLDEIRDLLFLHGYAVAETFHDCGELGGLAQRRRRFLLVARHRRKVPPFLYEPPKQRVRGVGEVIGELPPPDAPEGGPMHRCPRLTWETWVRLALIPAGGDWRSLEGMDFSRIGIEPLGPRAWGAADLGVTAWTDPAATVSGRGGPRNGAFSVQDPRPGNVKEGGKRHNDVFRVVEWLDAAGAVTAGGGPSSGGQAVQDPRDGDHGRFQTYRVLRYDEPSPTVTTSSEPGNGGYTVADPLRPGLHGKWHVAGFDGPTRTVIGANGTGQGASACADPRWGGGGLGVIDWTAATGAVSGEGYPSNGPYSVADPRLGAYGQHANKLRVESWTSPAHTVTTSDRVGSGAPSVGDPRVPTLAKVPTYNNLCRVEHWDQPSHTVVGGTRPAGGALSVADPRVYAKERRDDYKTAGHYGVVEWVAPAHAVTAHGQHDNGAFSVADPRALSIPEPLDRPDPVPLIIALDGTWHRPFTTLELAALQSFPVELFLGTGETLSGTSHTTWREHIGNAVPRASSRAIGTEMLRTLLMASMGHTFSLNAAPIWVQPFVAAMSLDRRPPLEIA